MKAISGSIRTTSSGMDVKTNIIAITDKESGKIVWQVGPDYDRNPALREIGWIIGQHHAHMIPRGLPGEGNILVFDNGGFAGIRFAQSGSADRSQ